VANEARRGVLVGTRRQRRPTGATVEEGAAPTRIAPQRDCDAAVARVVISLFITSFITSFIARCHTARAAAAASERFD
jgi:hypothetical protein